MAQEPELDAVARTVKREWEQRANSPHREFFVASHEGWDTSEGRDQQARIDVANMLSLIDRSEAVHRDFLEVGCGSGRLAAHIAPLFRSYTGVDIAPTMVAVARKNCQHLANARFFESDGLSLPPAARDREYDYALAAAVLIHCSKAVSASLSECVMRQLRPGGQFRLQIYADIHDPEGITPMDDGIIERANRIQESASPAQTGLIEGTLYEGHRFRYAEAKEWLESLGDARLMRFDQYNIYAIVSRRG